MRIVVICCVFLAGHGNLLGIVAFEEIELGIWTSTIFEIDHIRRLLDHRYSILDELPIL